MKAATIRFESGTHLALKRHFAESGETLQGLVIRLVEEYLDSQDKPTPEREEFLRAAKLFYRNARPDVREWLLATMRATIESKEKK